MYSLYHEDCLTGMDKIPTGSVDMILCDLPYGVTKNKWDAVIPFDKLWNQYKRVIKHGGAIVLFAEGMFMANLMVSNPEMWRYNLIWDKVLTSGFLNANRMPLRQHEQLCVFYKSPPTYNPQKKRGEKSHSKGSKKKCQNNNYGDYGFIDNSETHGVFKYPTSILSFPKPHPTKAFHPTEKPITLLEYLIKSYTNPGEMVLDNCMGSGSTGVAAIRTGRNFIGFEIEKKYFDIAKKRIEDAKIQEDGAHEQTYQTSLV